MSIMHSDFKKLVALLLATVLLFTCGSFASANAEITTPFDEGLFANLKIHLNMSKSADGGFVLNQCGKDHNATVTGNPAAVSGPDGDDSALHFANNGQYLRIENPSDFDFTGDFAISLTFNQQRQTGYEQMLLVKRNLGANMRDFQIYSDTSHRLCFIMRDANDNWVKTVGAVPSINEWHTLVASVENNVMSLYLDGVLQATTTIANRRSTTTSAPIGIGGDPIVSGVVAYSYISDVKITTPTESDLVKEYFAPTVTPDIHLDMADSSDLGKDVSGGGNDAVIEGTLSAVEGYEEDPTAVGGFYTGTNSMYVPSPEDMSFADDFSASITFKTDDEPVYHQYRDLMLVSKRDVDANKREFQLFIQGKDHTVAFIIRDASDTWVGCYGPEVTVGEWHTAVATVKDNVMQLYFDGVLVDTTVITTGRAASTDAPIGIGSDPNAASYFFGSVSDVKISDEAAKYPQMSLTLNSSAEAQTMAPGNYIFSDRCQTGYAWSSEMPAFFRDKKHCFNAIQCGIYEVETGGLLYALTPDETISGAAPQEDTLRNYGFTRLEGLDFQAFGTWNANYVHVYAKQVMAGDVYEIGKWAILVADDMTAQGSDYIDNWKNNNGEVLYNGITLPETWPPTTMATYGSGEMPVPYLDSKPEVININTGRQLFVDDFLIASTDLTRTWHKAEKYDGNPILQPETEQELGRVMSNGQTYGAVAAPFSGGVWYDSTDNLFKMWYNAGWHDGTAYATSKDGINWDRPELDVEPGTNLILPLSSSVRRDSTAVIMDPFADITKRFKFFIWSRPTGGQVYTSADGIHWGNPTSVASTGDRTTIFYNPFRDKWVYSIRSYWASGRSREYHECDDLVSGSALNGAVKWARVDSLDIPDPVINQTPVLYNLDAVAYESVMLGAFSILLGPTNEECGEVGIPKVTELHMGFSRDGFHWARSEDRTAFIGATQQAGSWERGYLHSNAAICLVNDDELWFYYTGFEGNEEKKGADKYSENAIGTYDKGRTGLATLRRDGFASMNTETSGTLTTETVTFDGKYLFVNANAKSVKAEILDENGNVIEGYSKNDCTAVKGDTTKAMLSFGRDLSSLSGKNVKFRFYVEEGELYSFWVTDDSENGASNGYLAGGSVGQKGLVDTAESYTLKGDLNEDGSVDNTDRVVLRKKLIGSETGDLNENAADVNGDGYVNICDLVAIETKIKKQ